MPDSKARIYLDVDGVINSVRGTMPQGKKRERIYTRLSKDTGWDKWFQVKTEGYPITTATDRIQALKDLSEMDGVQVRWLTTWMDLAPNSLAPAVRFGAGADFPVIGHEWSPEFARGYAPYKEGVDEWWKLYAIQEDVEDYEGKVVWLDDDLGFASTFITGLPDFLKRENLLALSPLTEDGLTVKEVDEIKEYIT